MPFIKFGTDIGRESFVGRQPLQPLPSATEDAPRAPRAKTKKNGAKPASGRVANKSFSIERGKDGGLTISARITHGPNDMHSLVIPAKEVRGLRKEIVSFHDALHEEEGVSGVGIESLDSDLIDTRRRFKSEYMRTNIVGESTEESLKGV